MKKKTKCMVRIGLQQGISLVISLIMLLIMTVIGISAMNTSISKLKMTGSIQQQSVVSNNTEGSLSLGEARIQTANIIPLIAGANGFFESTVNVNNDTVWTNAFNGQNGGEFIIEYLGERVEDGGSMAESSDDETVHIYRVTARSIDANNTRRMFQSLWISENAPN